MGKWSNCCCEVTLPEFLEEKDFRLVAPFPGYTIFDTGSFSGHFLGFSTTHYLVKQKVTTDENGYTHTETTTWDADSGVGTNSTATDSGYTGITGAFVSSTVADTVITEIRERGSVITSLLEAYELEDCCNLWRGRLDAIIATSTLRNRQTIEFRTLVSSSPEVWSDPTEYTFEFPSVIDAESLSDAYDFIWLAPHSVAPWDDTYSAVAAGHNTLISPDQYHTWGQDYGGEAVGIPSAPQEPWHNYSSGTWSVNDVRWVLFQKKCQALPQGINCTGVTDFELPRDNYMHGDLAVVKYNLATGEVTRAAANIELSPGWHTFDGRSLYSYSGNKLSPSTPIEGIDDGLTSGFLTFCALRTATFIPSDPRSVPDYCP